MCLAAPHGHGSDGLPRRQMVPNSSTRLLLRLKPLPYYLTRFNQRAAAAPQGHGGDGLPRRLSCTTFSEAMPRSFRPSSDTPGYYLTSVTAHRLPVFRTEPIAKLACEALDEARRSGGFLIFAYVVMPDHLHLVTDSSRKPKEIHRFVNGIISRRVIDHLKEEGHDSSLDKLRVNRSDETWKYSLWDHNPDTRLLWTEQMVWQRIQYTHLNPVRAGLFEHPLDWKWSSARIFLNRRSDDEPLEVDLSKIKWSR
jgi:putative transposase